MNVPNPLLVVKLGGSALDQQRTMLADIRTIWQSGWHVVVVHGGGPAVSHMLDRLALDTRFHNGLRVTDAAVLEVVQMVLGGQTNQNLVGAAQTMGIPAVGLTGLDGGLLAARAYREMGDIGFVGTVTEVRLAVLSALLAARLVPIIAPLGLGSDGQIYNLNADTAAGALAAALASDGAVFLTDIAGVKDAAGTLVSRLNADGVEAMIADGVIHGGMIPKVTACLAALHPPSELLCVRENGAPRQADGARAAVILDGRQVGSLVHWVHQRTGGTTIVP